MSLSIGVSTGSRISVGDHVVRVKSINSPNLFVVDIDGGNEVVISEREKIEVLPDVFVQSGVGQKGGGNRLAFDAPRSIKISRIEESRRSRHENRRSSQTRPDRRAHLG
jgi:sRNA-binding carbon storage regulator CsrA